MDIIIPSFSSLIQALLIGCLYGLIALSISILFGVAKVINWAYGNMFVFLMYCSWGISVATGVDPLLLVPLMAVISIPLFFVLHRFIEPLVFKEDIIAQLVVTLGFSMIFYGLIYVIFGIQNKNIMSRFTLSTIKFGDTIIQLPYLIVGIVGFVLLIISHFLITRTWYGKAIIATAQNKTLIRIFGIKLEKIYYIVIAAVAIIAGIASSFLFTIWGVTADDGSFYITLALVITLLVKPGSVLSALLGGIIISYMQLLTVSLLGNWSGPISVYILFIIVLLLRQNGIRKKAGLKGGISE